MARLYWARTRLPCRKFIWKELICVKNLTFRNSGLGCKQGLECMPCRSGAIQDAFPHSQFRAQSKKYFENLIEIIWTSSGYRDASVAPFRKSNKISRQRSSECEDAGFKMLNAEDSDEKAVAKMQCPESWKIFHPLFLVTLTIIIVDDNHPFNSFDDDHRPRCEKREAVFHFQLTRPWLLKLTLTKHRDEVKQAVRYIPAFPSSIFSPFLKLNLKPNLSISQTQSSLYFSRASLTVRIFSWGTK